MEKVRGLSIFGKTGLLAFCLFGVIAVSTSALTAYTLYDRMTREYVSKGSAIAASIAGASQEILLNRDMASVQSMIDQYLDIEGVAYVFVLDGEGVAVSHTFVPQMPPRLMGLHSVKHGDRIDELDVESYGRIIDICEPILAGVAGYVHVGMDKDLIMSYFWAVVVKMQLLLSVIFAACVVILFVVTRRISKPLTQLTEYAERLEAHDFSAEVSIRSNDELSQLGQSMQSMARELAALFTDMEREVSRATGDLKEHMVYLAAINDNLADGLLVVNPAGKVSVLNPVMREFFDLGDKDYLGFASSDVFPEEVSRLAASVRVGIPDVRDAEIPLSRGRTGKAVGSSILLDDPERTCLGGIVLIRDVTREKELDKLKTDFISTVSHELRTPMTSVLGFSKIIRKKLDQIIFPAVAGQKGVDRPVGQIRENMAIIVSEAERLTELINDVLDIAKMEAGEIQWRDQVVFMGDVIRQAIDSTRGLWRTKGLELVADVEKGLPPVRGDRARLIQVMVNLISNSVKFTAESPIVCRARKDGLSVLVSVSDKGVGIAGEDLGDIFEKFKQAGDTLTEKPAGTGLGLPISRQIVEHHGGRIWAESELGRGSVFSFSMPAVNILAGDDPGEDCRRILPEPDTALLVRAPLHADAPPLILVVDDDPTLHGYLRQVFEDEGFRVEVAMNGEEAVALARDLLPSLITMDLMMPGMDGHAAIRCLRSNPFTRHIPVLVLSALTDGVAAGGDVALVKPVDDTRLLEVVRALLLEKDVRRSCIVLGDEGEFDPGRYTVVLPDHAAFCHPDEIWAHVEKGFSGTIFIPAELGGKLDVELLSRLPDVAVVILPAGQD